MNIHTLQLCSISLGIQMMLGERLCEVVIAGEILFCTHIKEVVMCIIKNTVKR